MTITNIYLPADRRSAICAVDTAMATCGAHFGDTSKFMLMAHGPAALLARGSMRFFGLVADDVRHTRYPGFDHLAEYLPTLARAAAQRHVAELGPLAGANASELALVGRSEAAGGYRAVWYAQANDFAPVEQRPGLALRPSPPGYHVPPRSVEPTDAELIAVAECQMAQTRVDFGDPGKLGSGGRLIRINLALDGAILIRVIHHLSASAPDQATAQGYVATVRKLLAGSTEMAA